MITDDCSIVIVFLTNERSVLFLVMIILSKRHFVTSFLLIPQVLPYLFTDYILETSEISLIHTTVMIPLCCDL
jgi:hypothetical protein